MLNYICFNGKFIQEHDWIIGSNNRGFLYGDALFESIRFHDGHIHFIEDHLDRLILGMKMLGFNLKQFDRSQIRKEISELCKLNEHHSARIRITVYRNDGGKYRPTNDFFSTLISSERINTSIITNNKKGLRLGLFAEIKKPINSLAGIKSSNGLLYVLAARYARENNWDDSILINEHGRICESSSSNIFLVLPDKSIITPSLSEGILPGVMRKNLLSWLIENNYKVEETKVSKDDLLKAEEVFLSNAIQGIRWAVAYNEKRYFSNLSRKIIDAFFS